ncbi:MAG: methylated-DNA--protein-cysteine methyltransferase [Candidatus Roseilinea sp.]|nr:MAG: methylated-DNA--protein-cysteine methyltransferase [Candidatus Roseilinea sp.]
MYQAALDTPIGRLMIEGTRKAVTAVRWVTPDVPVGKGCKVVIQARKQLREYFEGKRRTFDVPISLDRLTDFQRAVLMEVRSVGYGETITYAEIARRLKKATAPRAVGQANARNPINIIVPCHRVLSSNGKLTGYAGGVQAKAWLLKHEQAVLV